MHVLERERASKFYYLGDLLAKGCSSVVEVTVVGSAPPVIEGDSRE